MSDRSSLLAALWRKLFPAKPKPAPVRLAAAIARDGVPRASRSVERGIEPLEGRIAPAVLLPGGKAVTYTDLDGDLVTITFSKAIFAAATPAESDALLQSVLQFNVGEAHTGAPNATDDVPQLLQKIDLTALTADDATSPARGISFSVTASKFVSTTQGVPDGDGLVNVGAIYSENISLGSIKIGGDLGQIDAGNANVLVGVQALQVKTLGKLTNTQMGTANYESTITGQLGSFTADSIHGAYLHVIDGFDFIGTARAQGSIGTVNIALYITATSTSATAVGDGVIEADRTIGVLNIGSGYRDANNPLLSHGLIGGTGVSSGSVIAAGGIGTVTVKGDLLGGAGDGSGSINAGGAIRSVNIQGALIGGAGDQSANLHSDISLGTVTIGRLGLAGLLGGEGEGSALVSSDGNIGSVIISNIKGGGGNSANISALGNIGTVTVNGSIEGGTGAYSGSILASGTLGNVTVGVDLLGGSGGHSGTITSGGKMGNLTILGKVQGGTSLWTGAVFSGVTDGGGMGAVKIGKGLIGGSEDNSGLISSAGGIASLTISAPLVNGVAGDAVLGGDGASSGTVYADGVIGTTLINGNIHGGAGDRSGTVQGTGLLRMATVTGNIVGGAGESSGGLFALDGGSIGRTNITGSFGTVVVKGSVTGGEGRYSGEIRADGNITSVSAAQLLEGGDPESGRIIAGAGLYAPGNISTIVIGKIGQAPATSPVPVSAVSGGTVIAYGNIGTFTAGSIYDAQVSAGDAIASFTVNGDVISATVTARGQQVANNRTDVAFGKIVVKGQVLDSDILAGYTVTGQAANRSAQIGTVQVSGNWSASNLVAGVQAVNGDDYGLSTDYLIASGSTVVSRIASITIGGAVSGTSASEADHFGFVAREIGAFSSAAGKLALSATAGQSFDLGSDVTVREVQPTA